MNTAVDDGLIRRNPCRIKGAGNEDSPERPVLTVPQVYALADAIGPRYRAPILLATFASLRRAELDALTRRSALLHPSSSPARTALRCVTATSTGVYGCLLLPLSACPTFTFTTCAIPATSSPQTRAHLRELMEHMGHDSTRAALIYLHTSAERQRAIADQVSKKPRRRLASTSVLARGWHAKRRRRHERTYRPLLDRY